MSLTLTSSAPTWPAGYRIEPRAAGSGAELVAAFREIPVAAAGDCS